MESYRALLLLPDPLFVARFLRKDMFYRDLVGRCKQREDLQLLIAKGRRELSNLITYQENPPIN